jgi:nitrate reductase cytochrome c-type subunit
MKTTVILSLAAVLAAGCSSSATTRDAFPAPSGPIADADLGLSKGSVFDAPTPAMVKANDSNPGESPLLPRPYVIAPPRIPHAVADFLPITQKQNACLDCHAVKERKRGDPTPIPPSHYTDYRNAPDRVADQVVGARHVCVSCHAVKTDAPNLVGNRFRP